METTMVMKRAKVFVFLVVAGGFGGLVGSITGAVFGSRTLFIGGVVGGLVAIWSAAGLAGRMQWIVAVEVKGTAVGAALGFLAAAAIAVNTLSSPVGPALSTLCIGIGGLAGGRLAARRTGSPQHTDDVAEQNAPPKDGPATPLGDSEGSGGGHHP